jgi:uncharacterized protein DUF1579
MKSRSLFAAIALCACTAGIAAALTIQDKGKEKPAEKPKAAPASAPMMDPKMIAYMTPGAEHKMLESKAGKWHGKGKFWQTPDGQPMESEMDTEYTMSMGRFLTDTTHSDMMGMPFEGHGVTGFDNMKKKYVATWMDNMGTGILSMEGTYDAASKTMTLSGDCPDPMAGKATPMKMITKENDANSFVMEMQCTDAKSGKLFKCMEITYTRAK